MHVIRPFVDLWGWLIDQGVWVLIRLRLGRSS